MAKKFLLISLPESEIAAKPTAWVQQLLDEAEALDLLDEASEMPAAIRISRSREDYWSIQTCHSHPSYPTGFNTYGYDFGGFSSKGAFLLGFEAPDAVVLIGADDVDVFAEICTGIDIETVRTDRSINV